MLLNLILLTVLTGHVQSVSVSQTQEWNSFKAKYAKRYEDNLIDSLHFKSYKRSKELVAETNKLYHYGKIHYYLELNEYSDVILNDYKRRTTRKPIPSMRSSRVRRNILFDLYIYLIGKISTRPRRTSPRVKYNENSTVDMNRSPNLKKYYEFGDQGKDWRKEGVISPVQNQNTNCSSCWAFSASSALEAHLSITYRKTVTLSPKNLLDCTPAPSFGCKGGHVSTAFHHIMEQGIAFKDSYQAYTPRVDNCNYQRSIKEGTMKNYTTINNDEHALAEAVYNHGPVAVSIHPTDSFKNYKGGVFYEKNCPNKRKFLTHSMLVVGFGTDKRGGDYWLIKNSYGVNWGEAGYIRMARNQNMCGVGSIGQYPIV